ncbi:MAG TPA: GGDEF domain-containing protein [Rhizomicrobium sp.]
MRAERTVRAAALRRTQVYAPKLEGFQPAAPSAEAAATASVLGIPEREFTPRVRHAVTRLMAEVDQLRRELRSTVLRLVEAEHSADRDQLLPLLNRRAFVRELTRAIGLSSRYGMPSSLLYFDLDEFKRVNDSYGHAAGDAVLAHFAETLSAHVRDSDVVARLGGDEFGIILAHTDQQQAEAKAESLANALFASPVLWDGRQIDICFSWGVFELVPGDTAESAIARADELMYARKRAR